MQRTITTASTTQCHWCGVFLGNATQITYLNGNLACCDLCLAKSRQDYTQE